MENLICSPTEWTDYIIFFAINYMAHAFTLMSRPGETISERIMSGICAFFVPGTGAIRSLRWVFSHPITASSALEEALRAGAICMVVKKNNAGQGGVRDPWFAKTFKGHNVRLVPIDRTIHGQCKMPEQGGFYLAEVPMGLDRSRLLSAGVIKITIPPSGKIRRFFYRHSGADQTRTENGIDLDKLQLPRTYSFVKILVGLIQTLYAMYTLYKALGSQIDMYGMVAFGLTVTPYGFMSIINSIAAMVTPEYPSMFLIRTPDMEKAEEAGGKFGGFIAKLIPDAETTKHTEQIPLDFLSLSSGSKKAWFYKALLGILIFVPLAVIGGLSKFTIYTGEGTSHRNGWVLTWLLVGSVSSIWVRYVHQLGIYKLGTQRDASLQWYKVPRNLCPWLAFYLMFAGPLCIPAIGGMVQVALMMKSYGSCVKLSFNPFG